MCPQPNINSTSPHSWVVVIFFVKIHDPQLPFPFRVKQCIHGCQHFRHRSLLELTQVGQVGDGRS